MTIFVAGAGLVRNIFLAVARKISRPWLAVARTRATSLRLANPYSKCEGTSNPRNTRQKSAFADLVFRVAGAGFAPATSRLCMPLRLSPLQALMSLTFVVWTIPSPFPRYIGE